jgi:ABC-type amino acid transport substrate-binding protein
MDDERIERALRLGPLDEPVFVPRGRWRATDGVEQDAAQGLAAVETHASRETSVLGTEWVRPIGVRVRGGRRPSRRSFPMTIAASLALAIGLLLATQFVPAGPAATPAPSPDLLARLLASGSLKIAVSNGAPQTVAQGGAYIGFDVGVARAIAGQIGLQAEITPVAPDGFGSGGWDLALPGHAAATLGGVQASDPYAWWPVWLAAPEGSPVTDIASLGAARVCVVGGSAGASWLAGGMAGSTFPPPSAALTVTTASDEACISAVMDGRADAMLTSTLLSSEVQARGLHLVAPSPVVVDPWSVVVRGPAGDSASALAAVNEALDALRTSGELADLSRSSFGGLDVTVPQP